MSAYLLNVPVISEGQKWSDSLELELQMLVSIHAYAGNKASALCKNAEL